MGNGLPMENGRPRPSIVSGTQALLSAREPMLMAPRRTGHNIVKNLRIRSNPRSNSAIVVA